MRICHIVTLLSVDGSFGGPANVALSQAHGLAGQGHTVSVLAASDGQWENHDPQVWVQTFPAKRWTKRLGFGGITSPNAIADVARLAPSVDVFHVHLGRDGVTLPACLHVRSLKVPYVVQCHGMVMPDKRRAVGLTDIVGTRRALQDAGAVLYLTEVESNGLREIGGSSLRLLRLVNGVEEPNHSAPSTASRSGILFCSRLHPRKRVLAFAEMVALLREYGVSEPAFVVGPDEGDLAPLRDAIDRLGLADSLTYEGALPHSAVQDRLARARVLVLPSEDEPFPMVALEAMAIGTPVVVTTSCHIAEELSAARAALVSDLDPASLADAVRGVLDNQFGAEALADRARQLITSHYSLNSVVAALEAIYEDAVKSSGDGRPGAESH